MQFYTYTILQAFLLAATLSIMLGPIFFTILDVTLAYGSRKGLIMISGAWLSDIIFAIASYLGISAVQSLLNTPNFKLYLGLTGGSLLIVLGISSYINANSKLSAAQLEIKPSTFALFTKGFFVNTLNPFNLIFWLGITTSSLVYKTKDLGQEVFLVSLIVFVIMTDILKVFLAKQIKNKLTGEKIIQIRKASGAIVILLGILLLIRSIY